MAQKKVSTTRQSRKKKVYSEKEVLAAKTPEDYIERTLNSEIPRGRKTVLCKQWKEKTGYSTDDIQYARNRHPYWKQKKMKGWKERNQKRWDEHNYRGSKPQRGVSFDTERINQFYDLNKKKRDGSYTYRDWEIAREMEITIPAVQHWRRKQTLVYKLLDVLGKKHTKNTVLKYMQRHENGLRKELQEV